MEQENMSIHKRIDRFEADLKKIQGTLQNILKCVQSNAEKKRMPRKPDRLPISTKAEMDAFQDIEDDEYAEVVSYLSYIGGFNLKEATNLCLKDVIKDNTTPAFSWWGRQGGPTPLYNARITIAIYEAVCNNKYFARPTRSEFQHQMREALRIAKQRHRNNVRRGQCVRGPDRNFLNDDAEDDTDDDNHPD